ncbi:MAG: WD40 repeat domain-containing protein, partial [Phormidesmis sp.]
MLRRFCLRGRPADYKQLIDRYYGHPMALRLAASAIKDMFYGRIGDFLDQEISVFDDLRSILKTQFKRLSPPEVEAMYWLSINHAPSTLESLQADIVSEDNKKNLLYTLQSLERRFLIEVEQVNGASYRLHPIVSEYVLSRFIRAVFSDLIRGNLSFFNGYALMKADAEELCRQFQKNAIVRPILERLKNHWKSFVQVEEYLNKKLNEFREGNPYRLGYAGGNFVNLMVELSEGKLTCKNFSELMIWQAYLQGAELRSVNFNRCELNRSVFTETLSDVVTVALNGSESDAKALPLLGCGDTNGMVHLWKTPTSGQSMQAVGQKCAEWAAHQGWVRSLIFMPKRSQLITGGDDSYLKLWQLPIFDQPLNSPPRLLWQQETSDWVHTIAVSQNGLMIANGGETTISLRDANSGQEICQFSHQAPHLLPSQPLSEELLSAQPTHQSSRLTKQSRVRSLAFSPDDQWLASCGDDNIIRLWSMASLRGNLREKAERTDLQPVAELTGHTSWVRSVQFSPDGAWLISGSDDGNVRVWSVATFTCQQILCQSSDRIRSIAISPDGRLFATGGDDCQIRLWDMQTYTLLETLPTQQSRIWSVAFQQWGHRLLLAAGGDKQTLMIWQVCSSQSENGQSENGMTENEPPKNTLPENDLPENDLSKGELTTTTPFSATARGLRTYRGYTDSLRAVSFLGTHNIISGGDSRELSVWESVSGELKAALSLHQGRILAIALDAQNTRIASASDDHTVRLWDATTGQCLKTFVEHTSWVRTVAFS